MNDQQLGRIVIRSDERKRNVLPTWVIFAAVVLLTTGTIYLAVPRASDRQRIMNTTEKPSAAATSAAEAPATEATAARAPGEVPNSILTVSGYIVNRERIELSPRFVGVVKWLGAKKGDHVKKGAVLVLLEDSEQRANLLEAEGNLAAARVALEDARLKYKRIKRLAAKNVESEEAADEARLRVDAAEAEVTRAQGRLALAQAHLDWTVIRSPVDGVVLEKLVDENELVSPQSFGGERSPSTALLALAELNDLQVEIDINERDLAKITMNQPCLVSPEAYPDRVYKGHVAEIAPEASRQKGTLQIKVQIDNPDAYLTPELSAKVDFLASREISGHATKGLPLAPAERHDAGDGQRGRD
jgi:HlyD family secretion protein